MSAAAYILAAVVAVLLIALVLCWMQPRKAKTSAGTLTIDIECDSAQAMAKIAELTAAVERLDAAQRKAGLNLPVRGQTTDPVMEPPNRLPPSPPPAPAKKRRTR